MSLGDILINVVIGLVSFLCAGGIGLLCYFLNGIYGEMKKLNNKLIQVVTNQEWHYSKITELENRVTRIENKTA